MNIKNNDLSEFYEKEIEEKLVELFPDAYSPLASSLDFKTNKQELALKEKDAFLQGYIFSKLEPPF